MELFKQRCPLYILCHTLTMVFIIILLFTDYKEKALNSILEIHAFMFNTTLSVLDLTIN